MNANVSLIKEIDNNEENDIQTINKCNNINDLIEISGNCHCKNITFTVKVTKKIKVYKCNCSICIMKQNHHFIVSQNNFKLLCNIDELTLYQFNTKKAKHYFCKNCGVQSFYYPRSNPDGVAITIYCIKDWKKIFDNAIEWIDFDGDNWESTMINSDIINDSKINS